MKGQTMVIDFKGDFRDKQNVFSLQCKNEEERNVLYSAVKILTELTEKDFLGNTSNKSILSETSQNALVDCARIFADCRHNDECDKGEEVSATITLGQMAEMWCGLQGLIYDVCSLAVTAKRYRENVKNNDEKR